MTTTIEKHEPKLRILTTSSLAYPYDVLLKILTGNVLIAFQWEAIFISAFLNLNNISRKKLPAIKEETFPKLKQKEAISEPCWEKINVKNVENIKTVEQVAEKKRRGKKKSDKHSERKRKEQSEEREAEEKERLRKWEECWERNLKAQEERDDAECCIGKDLCVRPKTQSNIWINVTQDRSIQEIHMTIKHVPVSRPKPPPLPPLKAQKPTVTVSMEKSDTRKIEKSKTQKVEKKCSEKKKKK
ncbi:hypothetical protein WN48_02975 [Eufriesea mexicana]|uniref:Uncharacterized protein n=1 Tax=Eufriesea mexicana TaxID=516756 RepID=A0A310S4L2_9HYME|nr:hypothetical protein WN48_02975 [Eufriesea mexicana]